MRSSVDVQEVAHDGNSARNGANSRVLITGASGYLAQQIVPRLLRNHQVTLTDVRAPPSSNAALPPIEVFDILDEPSAQRLTALMQGVDTVIHLAYRPARRIDTTSPASRQELSTQSISRYEDERRNIDLAQRVYQTALDTGVRRVICASSNHASSWHETLYQAGLKQTVYPYEYPKPASFYGWSKVAYESLGFLYACGSLGRKLEIVMVRICAPRPLVPAAYVDAPPTRYVRDLAGYLSPRDCAQLFERAVETPDIRDPDGIPFLIVYAASNNTRKYWSLESARRVLGYSPVDDSEAEFAEDIRRIVSSAGDATGMTESDVRPSRATQ